MVLMSMILAAAVQSASIQPDARAVADALVARYASLKSLQCMVIDRSSNFPAKAELSLALPDRLQVIVLNPKRPGVGAQFFYNGEHFTVASQHVPARYLTATLKPQPFIRAALSDASDRAHVYVSVLADLLASSKQSPFDYHVMTAMTVASGISQADGEPVKILTLESNLSSGPRHTKFEVGAEDHLLRHYEDDLGQRLKVDFVDLKADSPIPASAFAYQPPPGARAVAPTKVPTGTDSKTKEIFDQIGAAYKALDSLSMRTSWSRDSTTIPAGNGSRDSHFAASLAFDLKRPLFDRTTLLQEGLDKDDNRYLVCDGTNTHTWEPGDQDWKAAPAHSFAYVAQLGGTSIPMSAGWQALVVAQGFAQGDCPLIRASRAAPRWPRTRNWQANTRTTGSSWLACRWTTRPIGLCWSALLPNASWIGPNFSMAGGGPVRSQSSSASIGRPSWCFWTAKAKSPT